MQEMGGCGVKKLRLTMYTGTIRVKRHQNRNTWGLAAILPPGPDRLGGWGENSVRSSRLWLSLGKVKFTATLRVFRSKSTAAAHLAPEAKMEGVPQACNERVANGRRFLLSRASVRSISTNGATEKKSKAKRRR